MDTFVKENSTDTAGSWLSTLRGLERQGREEGKKQSSAIGLTFSTFVTHPTSHAIHPLPVPKWKYDEASRSTSPLSLHSHVLVAGFCIMDMFVVIMIRALLQSPLNLAQHQLLKSICSTAHRSAGNENIEPSSAQIGAGPCPVCPAHALWGAARPHCTVTAVLQHCARCDLEPCSAVWSEMHARCIPNTATCFPKSNRVWYHGEKGPETRSPAALCPSADTNSRLPLHDKRKQRLHRILAQKQINTKHNRDTLATIPTDRKLKSKS